MKDPSPTPGREFLGLKNPAAGRSCRAVVAGPPDRFFEALIAASAFVELYDEELEYEPYRKGIRTEKLSPKGLAHRLGNLVDDGTFLCLAGYRGLPDPFMEGRGCGVVAFSPRGEVDWQGPGEKGNLAVELVVGPRSGRKKEAGDSQARVLTARQIASGVRIQPGDLSPGRPRVLVVDPFVLDPSLLPVRGNIEPGGLQWHPLTELLRAVFTGTPPVAALILPCRLPARDRGPAFILARLAAKLVAYALAAEG